MVLLTLLSGVSVWNRPERMQVQLQRHLAAAKAVDSGPGKAHPCQSMCCWEDPMQAAGPCTERV